MPYETLRAENPYIVERLVVAPTAGRFTPTFAGLSASSPEPVIVGEEVGVVLQMGEKYPVCSRFSGWLMGLLVLPGERVRANQPVAWLRPRDSATDADDPAGYPAASDHSARLATQ
jgi:hypothetical protein